ncbi:imelysin family protein [Paraliomyxa miuraensis]|uniref:imelysin family protein n=1 Tax=Paraliomyxa miuraensis TaxID=376150 RepID=UPI002255E5F5|nr:imelysin family protein [Paraliomyxa miuraensis]MCX4247557.1 imelysin family protein [Paraliomyxa miuraensis]
MKTIDGLGLVCGCALLLGCSDDEPEDFRRRVLVSWGEHVILPLQHDFEARAVALDESGRALCEAPSAERLAAAQAAWWDAREPWKQSEIFAFGPYEDAPLRLGPKIDFWPARVEDIELVLGGTDPIAAEILGATQIGLPVVEYLLHQPSAADVALVDELAQSPRRCDHLRVTTGDLVVRAGQMRQAWDPEEGAYLLQLTHPEQGDSMFETLHMALGEVVNRMAHTIENIRVDKLGRPLGTTEDALLPDPDTAESRFSGRSLQDIRDNLRVIERLYFGDDSPQSLGLDDYAREQGHDFTQTMADELASSREALDLVPEPLTLAVVDAPGRVDELIRRLGALQRLIQVDILNALSLTPTFNDNDGD